VVIYTKKRNGTFKARAVALGNHQEWGDSSELYSPAISLPAVKFQSAEAASKGHGEL